MAEKMGPFRRAVIPPGRRSLVSSAPIDLPILLSREGAAGLGSDIARRQQTDNRFRSQELLRCICRRPGTLEVCRLLVSQSDLQRLGRAFPKTLNLSITKVAKKIL